MLERIRWSKPVALAGFLTAGTGTVNSAPGVLTDKIRAVQKLLSGEDLGKAGKDCLTALFIHPSSFRLVILVGYNLGLEL